MIETLIISLIMTILQIIELLRVRKYLREIRIPMTDRSIGERDMSGKFDGSMDPLNSQLRGKLLNSIIAKVKGQRGNFLNNNLD